MFIVKKLVESQQGKVWCESVLGQGATFTVQIPVAKKSFSPIDAN
ncbi:MAG: hypothetical protein B6247_09800 [Candidatus Parabeggiatoa sp. nov. 2]|nr:MAG: hypothetical protein B6247_09800 [Beggiatoa sp. 4572_84]